MPVPFANELRGPAGESQDDLLEIGVFALPDLKTIPEEALNLPLPWPWIGKLVARFARPSASGRARRSGGLCGSGRSRANTTDPKRKLNARARPFAFQKPLASSFLYPNSTTSLFWIALASSEKIVASGK